ncbi:PEP/pyruvate-binding domain-containing protein [Aquabacterium sp.]|uniref:PEP/pyruvate-binding domain-containing protein n=1 Tax=Aquabacterium sp. TaxID=1872578 RepID=UPI0035AE308C
MTARRKPAVVHAAHHAAPASAHFRVVLIGGPQAEADVSVDEVGNKAFNLWRMHALGLRVPPALVLGTSACNHVLQSPSALAEAAHATLPADVRAALDQSLAQLEAVAGARFGDVRNPLLLSVRSGAAVSMPGMMETLLNVGLCDATLPGFVRRCGNPRLAWDAYRRLVATYGEVVLGIEGQAFERVTQQQLGTERDERTLDFAQLRELTRSYLDLIAEHDATGFPQDPRVQLERAVLAVFRSWQSAKAIEYRKLNHIDERIGTAVTVQTMVFGNAGGSSGAGVGFSRNPINGEPQPWVDFMFNAQGEDVVSGRRSAQGHDELAEVLPSVWSDLREAAQRIERAFADMQDFEFTVQEAQLYMLQARNGKRTPLAAARIALDLHDEGLLSVEETRQRLAQVREEDLAVARVVLDGGSDAQPVAEAAAACAGVVTGEIALDEARARERHAAGVSVILLRQDAETSDIAALEAAVGLLTSRGARTSHAAVVARQLGKVCLVGCNGLEIDLPHRQVRLGDAELREGDVITLDGNEGHIYLGAVRVVKEVPDVVLQRLRQLRGEATAAHAPQAHHHRAAH